jgi:hypothetical protein
VGRGVALASIVAVLNKENKGNSFYNLYRKSDKHFHFVAILTELVAEADTVDWMAL